jgi:two-component system sensor histidine kinase and response regulator WspE
MSSKGKDLSSMSMMDLFRQEAENHCAILSEHLLALEKNPADQEALSALMRAAHSIKGAARIMDLNILVGLTHAMEDVFVAAQKEKITIDTDDIDLLLRGVDKLGGIASLADKEIEDWFAGHQAEMDDLKESYAALASGTMVKKPPVEELQEEETQEKESLAEDEPEEAISEKAAPKESGPKTFRPASKTRPKKEFPADLSSMSMMDLFRQEAEIHCATLSDNLLTLEKNSEDPEALAALMRAAQSIKGAARVIELHVVVGLAHAMEDVFVGAQEGKIVLDQDQIDFLLRGTDMFTDIADQEDSELNAWFADQEQSIKDLENTFKELAAGKRVAAVPKLSAKPQKPVAAKPESIPESKPAAKVTTEEVKAARKPEKKKPERKLAEKAKPQQKDSDKEADRFLRVSAEGMNRLMGFAGEVQVESRWLPSFSQKILRLKLRQDDIHRLLNIYSGTISSGMSEELTRSGFKNLIAKMDLCRNLGNEILSEVEDHARRATEISHHLYQEVLANRMRPFADGIKAFPRMVRDIARELGKKVEFVIIGEETLVDRDILEKIEAPLNHLIRNALDHGVESPENRLEAGKPETAVIRLEARHSAGMLSIVVSDDGPGIDVEKLRQAVIDKKMIGEDMAHQLRESELFEFIFLPNFSTRDSVTKVSGRGVGMDVVHRAVHEVRGIIRTNTELGVGTTFELQLPLTLSVTRTLLVEISDEVYAFPLVAIDHVVRLKEDVREIEGRQYINFNNERIGLVSATQVLEKPEKKGSQDDQDELLVVVISDRYNRYGLIVDRFLEIRDLVVQPLDRRLKKVQDINAVAILEDGTPVLIVDVEDMVRSIDSLISGNRLRRIGTEDLMVERTVKRILVVDDSITVREVERKMLANKGYDVQTAVDGLDGWNTLRSEDFDLVVSDIDMPRMDGIEFITHIRQDPRYESIPVIIVSYKDQEEDRNRGLEAGADYYLTKGSFQDETLVRTVEELIGTPPKKELNRS